MDVEIFRQVFFFDEEQREDDVAQAAGDPDGDEQKCRDAESFRDAEVSRVCAQDMEQRGRRRSTRRVRVHGPGRGRAASESGKRSTWIT